VTTGTKLRAAGIAGIGVLWGSMIAALGHATFGFVLVLLACIAAGVALAVPTRWHLQRLRHRAQAAAASTRTSGDRLARSLAAGTRVATAAARSRSERVARTAAARAAGRQGAGRAASAAHRPAARTLARRAPHDRAPRAPERQDRTRRRHRDEVGRRIRKENDAHGEALALNALALAEASAGRYTEAVAALDRALQLVAQTDKRHDEGRILANLGVVHRKAGGAEAAKECLAQALERLDSDSRESEHAAALLRATG
jgi:tetratricopeptide (TPR) repeat protein